jgi:hypothetical protein
VTHAGAGIAGVDVGIQNAVEGHRSRPRAHHGNHDPDQLYAKSVGQLEMAFPNASSAPVSAKGKAKTECSNLIISSVSRSRFQKAMISLPF